MGCNGGSPGECVMLDASTGGPGSYMATPLQDMRITSGANVRYFSDSACKEALGKPYQFHGKGCERKEFPWGSGIGFAGCSELGCGGCGGPVDTEQDEDNCKETYEWQKTDPGAAA